MKLDLSRVDVWVERSDGTFTRAATWKDLPPTEGIVAVVPTGAGAPQEGVLPQGGFYAAAGVDTGRGRRGRGTDPARLLDALPADQAFSALASWSQSRSRFGGGDHTRLQLSKMTSTARQVLAENGYEGLDPSQYLDAAAHGWPDPARLTAAVRLAGPVLSDTAVEMAGAGVSNPEAQFLFAVLSGDLSLPGAAWPAVRGTMSRVPTDTAAGRRWRTHPHEALAAVELLGTQSSLRSDQGWSDLYREVYGADRLDLSPATVGRAAALSGGRVSDVFKRARWFDVDLDGAAQIMVASGAALDGPGNAAVRAAARAVDTAGPGVYRDDALRELRRTAAVEAARCLAAPVDPSAAGLDQFTTTQVLPPGQIFANSKLSKLRERFNDQAPSPRRAVRLLKELAPDRVSVGSHTVRNPHPAFTPMLARIDRHAASLPAAQRDQACAAAAQVAQAASDEFYDQVRVAVKADPSAVAFSARPKGSGTGPRDPGRGSKFRSVDFVGSGPDILQRRLERGSVRSRSVDVVVSGSATQAGSPVVQPVLAALEDLDRLKAATFVARQAAALDDGEARWAQTLERFTQSRTDALTRLEVATIDASEEAAAKVAARSVLTAAPSSSGPAAAAASSLLADV
jgi:hypothetical protein